MKVTLNQVPILGTVMLFAGAYAPKNWSFCKGQVLDIDNNVELFSIIGSLYGGNGRTTFALPNLIGKIPLGTGFSNSHFFNLSSNGGAKEVVVDKNQLPVHSHKATISHKEPGFVKGNIKVVNKLGDSNVPGEKNFSNVPNAGIELSSVYTTDSSVTKRMSDSAVRIDTSNMSKTYIEILNTGNTKLHNNMQPYLAINYIICTNGAYPGRS